MLIVVSFVLPLVSHVFRQAVACAKSGIPTIAFGAFLYSYASSMLLNALYIDTLTHTKTRVVLLCFGVSFVLCVVVQKFAAPYFVVVWCIHAFFSSFLWPMSFRLVNLKPRSKIFLVLWSLQGNVGDLCGCRFDVFDNPFSTPSVAIGVTCTACLLFAIVVLSQKAIQTESLFDDRADASQSRFDLVVVCVASFCIKSMTYSASNFMPILKLPFTSYAVGSTIGTLMAGVCADAKLTLRSLSLVVLCLLVQTVAGFRTHLWKLTWFGVVFGTSTSYVSSMLSICMCTDIASRTKRYGKVTGCIDSIATLGAGTLQLVVETRFEMVQCACASLLSIAVFAMLHEGQRPLLLVANASRALRLFFDICKWTKRRSFEIYFLPFRIATTYIIRSTSSYNLEEPRKRCCKCGPPTDTITRTQFRAKTQ